MIMGQKILVTGGCGYIGHQLLSKLVKEKKLNPSSIDEIVSLDIKSPLYERKFNEVNYVVEDIRSSNIENLFKKYTFTTIYHLASIVTPPKGMTRETIHSIDVTATKKLIDYCAKYEVKRLVMTSSGAAYGYHADGPKVLDETVKLRGNKEIPYAYHKMVTDQYAQEVAEKHPSFEIVIFRVCTILGKNVQNLITNIFDKSFIVGVKGTSTPFSLIWDKDVIECLYIAMNSSQTGIYNLAADGQVTLVDISKKLNKSYFAIPDKVLKFFIRIGKKLGLTPYDPEQIKFLQFRPVLDNTKLKTQFKYSPQKSATEVFDFYHDCRQLYS